MDTEILAEALHFLYGGPEPWSREGLTLGDRSADQAAYRIRAEQLKSFYRRIEERENRS